MANSEQTAHQAAGNQQRAGHAAQTGRPARPAPPQPAQHLDKPGLEADMRQRPQFLALDYHGSGKLLGKTALSTGGDSGIGRAVAVLYAREGADVAIVYLNEHEDAGETRRYVEAEGQGCLLLPGDVRDPAFCRRPTSSSPRRCAPATSPAWCCRSPAASAGRRAGG